MPIIQLEDGTKLEIEAGLDTAAIDEIVDDYQSNAGGQGGPLTSVPGEYAASSASAAPGPPVSQKGSFLDPIAQGLSFGLIDEAAGLVRGFGEGAADLFGVGRDDLTAGDAYRLGRDQARANAAGFAERNPTISTLLELAGGIAIPGIGIAGQAAKGTLGLGKTIAAGAGAGTIGGFGTSTAEDAEGLATDTAIGGAIGGAGAGILRGAGNALSAGSRRVFGGPGVGKPRAASSSASSSTSRADIDLGLEPNPAQQASSQARSGATYQNHVAALDDAGVPLNPGQRSGNKAQIAAETTASETLAGGDLADVFDQQGTAVRARLMEYAGFTQEDAASGLIDRATIGNAQDRFAQRYGEALGDQSVNIGGDDFQAVVARLEGRHTRLLPFQQKTQVREVLEDFSRIADEGPISGEFYQELRSDLGALQRSQVGTNPKFAELYGDLRTALDDAFAEGAGPVTATAKRAIDRDYRNFKVLQRAGTSAGSDVAGGEPTIRSIANKARDRKKGGTTQFRDLADAAQNITTDRTPNSGTASRLFGLTSGVTGRAISTGIQAGNAVGLGQPSGPITAGAMGTLATGISPAIYNTITNRENLVNDEAEVTRRKLLLEQFGQAGQQLQGGAQ